jgi:hypothetical protein
MAEFNKENKISFDELSPSLQAMLKNCITQSDFDSIQQKITNMTTQLNGIRISVVTDTANISNPQNNKEVAIVLASAYTYICTYNNGWQKANAVYA